MRPPELLLLPLLLFGIVSCRSTSATSESDGSSEVNNASNTDASVADRDSGAGHDARGAHDAANGTTDAATRTDASSVSVDGGTRVDAAAHGDASAVTDAGVTLSDAGTSLPPDAGPAVYEVYPGCEAVPSTFARSIYLDPVSGTLAGDGSPGNPYPGLTAALNGHKILEGDHAVLLAGDHGSVLVSHYNNPALAASTSWLWIDFQPGATTTKIDLRDMQRWLITNATVSSAAANPLVAITNGNNMVFADSNIYTVQDSSAWTAQDWINTASTAMNVRDAVCTSVLRNHVLNVRFGIQVIQDDPDPATNRMKVLIKQNEVRNFSGDAFRPNASDVTVINNRALDEYVNAADGDANHDDALQMFALNGAVWDHVVIEGNWFQETTDPSRPFNADMQGIDCFDGLTTNVTVKNNVVFTSVWHGIALYGAADSEISHNTVVNSTTNQNKTWVQFHASKTGVEPVNCQLHDNISLYFVAPYANDGVTYANNIAIANLSSPNEFELFDVVTQQYDLHPKAGSSIIGQGVGSDLWTSHTAPLPP